MAAQDRDGESERAETVGDVGEFGLIDRIVARLPVGGGVIVGPGDDTAVVAAPDGRVVITTDVLVEGRHFRREWSSAQDVGHKAAAASLADVAAMGAQPTALVVGFGAPTWLPADWAADCSTGLAEEAARAGASVVGGDVVSAECVIVSVTAIGDLQGRRPVLRSGAQPGDVLALAGDLGESAAGLALLRAGHRDPGQVLAAHRRPQPPYPAGPAAAMAGASSMIDVSDGLVADARHLAEASGVIIEIDTSQLPRSPNVVLAAERLGCDPQDWLLQGGEDHALLASFPPATTMPAPFRPIGRVRATVPGQVGPGVQVDGIRWSTGGGFDHFD
ncbi:MAG: thiamine-phosphate kinase [Actinomycetales bacterium]